MYSPVAMYRNYYRLMAPSRTLIYICTHGEIIMMLLHQEIASTIISTLIGSIMHNIIMHACML